MLSSYQANQIISSVDREIQLHEKYLDVVNQERSAVSTIALESCDTHSSKREAICDQITGERNKRNALLQSLAQAQESIPQRLSEYVQLYFTQLDQKRIMPKIEALRTLVLKLQRVNQEFSQMLNFSLGLVTSSLSIIRSANQEVQKVYTGQGVARSSYHPVGHRLMGTLREA